MTNRIIVLFFVLLGAVAMLPAQTVTVTLTTDEGYERPAAISKAEGNLSRVLTEINAAQRENRNLNVVGLPMTDFAVKSLTMIWATVHFYCDDEEVVDRCWPFKDFMEVDHIPLIITPQGEEFGSGTYQEAVVEFDKNGRISEFRFALDNQLRESLTNCGAVVEEERRMEILQYVERFRTAYNTKDINFLQQVFSDDALIITGHVVTTKINEMDPGGQKVVYSKQNKQQYIANLKRAFARNKWIDVKFSQIGENGEAGGCAGITRSVSDPNKYGVRLRQEWKSSNYSDEGYLFLLWEFRDGQSPVVHVRTWQPEWVGGEKLPESEIFSLGDFNL